MKLKILPNIYGVFYFDNYRGGIAYHFTSGMFYYWRAVTAVKEGGEGRYAYIHVYSGRAAPFQGITATCVLHIGKIRKQNQKKKYWRFNILSLDYISTSK